MICLSDNDIVSKLAIFDLLPEALEALEASPQDVLVLPTAKYKFGIAGKSQKKQKFSPEITQRIGDFLTSVREVECSDSAIASILQNVHGIDIGEAALFSAIPAYHGSILATGDKVSLRAIAGLPEAKPFVESQLNGRVICFEQIILRIIKIKDFEYVKQKIVPCLDFDTAIRSAFGSRMDSTLDNVDRSLNSTISHLRKETGLILIEK